MKKTISLKPLVLAAFLALPTALFARPEIRRLSHFTLWCIMELRTEAGFGAPVKYTTLNHEGGLRFTVVELGRKERGGQWLLVTNTTPFWVEGGDWIEKYRRFWIFLPDDAEIFDFEK